MAATYKNIVKGIIRELSEQGFEVRIHKSWYGDDPLPWADGLYYASATKDPDTYLKSWDNNRYTIICPTPNDPIRLGVFLHEVGHIINGDCEDASIMLRRKGTNTPAVHKQEILASRYAIRRMRELGYPTKEIAHFLTRCIRTYECGHTFRP
jgi:hypothetical protein